MIKKYVDKSHHTELKKDIIRCFQGDTPDLDLSMTVKEYGIPECLNLSKILVTDSEINWQDSIFLAGKYLVQNGSIDKKYLDIILSQTMYYGPYMFITDHIMLAHAKPEDGVNKMDLSLAVFKNPVVFPKGKQAMILFVLAAEDQEKHLKILNDILKIAENPENTRRLTAADTKETVLAEILDILNQ